MPEIKFAWSELGGDPGLLTRVSTVVREDVLPARLPVRELARACVGACALAGAELGARRAGLPEAPAVRVHDAAVATAFVSERRLLVDGRAPVSFAPLSRFWRTADGWVRTHANYPHHRERLLRALALPESADPADVEASLAERRALDVEDAVYAAGGLAVASRTPEEWAAQEQAALIAARPLVERDRSDEARARTFAPLEEGPLLPASGVRVLDLTRVLAGPVATRTLALLGADVLRVDAPRLPELPDQHADTGFGKRSALLDLASDRRTFEDLLATADVVVTGYRPGALDRFGLSPEALAERRPGLVVAQVSAWGAYGPWGGRRGFDSLVQVATGIATVEGSTGRPGALPAQALDHGTGYLLAAAVLRALTEQSYDGGSRFVRLALARTAAWLTEGTRAGEGGDGRSGDDRDARVRRGDGRSERGRSEDGSVAGVRMDEGEGKGMTKAQDRQVSGGGSVDSGSWLAETDSPLGRLRHALSPVSFEGGPGDWSRPPGPWGADPARWLRSTDAPPPYRHLTQPTDSE